MNKLDTIRKKIEADRAQDEQRAADLEKIKGQLADLDKQIDEAIAADQSSTAEKLIADQNQLRTKMDIMMRISANKTAPDAYYDELIEINAEKVPELQAKVDKATAELYKARKAFLEKVIALINTLDEAASFRMECGVLAGIGMLYDNRRFDKFAPVYYDRDALVLSHTEKRTITEMEPDVLALFNNINSYCDFKNDR